jgi:hypothetical protein
MYPSLHLPLYPSIPHPPSLYLYPSISLYALCICISLSLDGEVGSPPPLAVGRRNPNSSRQMASSLMLYYYCEVPGPPLPGALCRASWAGGWTTVALLIDYNYTIFYTASRIWPERNSLRPFRIGNEAQTASPQQPAQTKLHVEIKYSTTRT